MGGQGCSQSFEILGRPGVNDVDVLCETRRAMCRSSKAADDDEFDTSVGQNRDELLKWLTGLKTAPRHVFAVHGEAETVASFVGFLKEKTGWEVSAPDYLDEVTLD